MKNPPRIFHECTNDGGLFEYSWFHSWMVVHFAGWVRRVEDLRGRMSAVEMQVEGLFENLLAENFGYLN